MAASDRERLRERMRAQGHTGREIAEAMAATFNAGPLLAYRWAYGLTQQQACDRYNALDASGNSHLDVTRLSKWENWPLSNRRPPWHALQRFAQLYRTSADRLVAREADFSALDVPEVSSQLEADENGDAELEVVSSEEASTTNRRQAISIVTGMAGGLALNRLTKPLLPPDSVIEAIERIRQAEASDVGPATLDGLEQTIADVGLEFLTTAPDQLRPRISGTLSYVDELLAGRHPAEHQRRLLAASGWLSGLFANVLFDAGDLPGARANCRTALILGERSEHAKLVAWAHDLDATMRFYRSDFSGAIESTMAGKKHARPATAMAIRLMGQEARAYARLGKTDAAKDSLRGIEKAFHKLPREEVAGGVLSIDPTFPSYAISFTAIWLGEARLAQQSADQVLDFYRKIGNEDRPIVHADRGLAQLAQGEPAGASADAVQALQAERMATPVAIRLGELHAALVRSYADVAEVRDFHERYVAFAARRQMPELEAGASLGTVPKRRRRPW